MSYNSARSDHVLTREWALAAGQGAVEEGTGLVVQIENGVQKCKVAPGQSNDETFAGFAMNDGAAPTSTTFVQTFKVPANAPYEVTLAKTLIGEAGVRLASGASLAKNAAAGDGQFNRTGNKLTFNAAQAGETVVVTGRHAPTALEAAMSGIGGFIGGGSAVTAITGTTGVFMAGVIYFDNFEPTDNWGNVTAATVYKLKAGGIATIASGATGATIPKARVAHVPDADNPLLGLSFNI